MNINKIKSIIYKHGIPKSIDMLVGGKNTIRQVYQDNPSDFLNLFNNLIPVEKNDGIYYVDKDRLHLFILENKHVYINYERIWMFFSEVIGLKTTEIETIIKNWFENTYNLKGLTSGMF